MAKNKRFSFGAFAGSINDKDVDMLEYHVGQETYELAVRKNLGFEEAMSFIEDVVNKCIDTESDIFHPEMFDFAWRMFTLVYYAGFKKPDDDNKAYRVLYCTDLYRAVLDHIDGDQVDVLVSAAREKVNYLIHIMMSEHRKKLDELINRMDAMTSEAGLAVAEITSPEFQNQMQNAIQALGSGAGVSVDSSNIVRM